MTGPVPSPADLDRAKAELVRDVIRDDGKKRGEEIMANSERGTAIWQDGARMFALACQLDQAVAAVVSLTEHADTLRRERDNERNKAKAMTGIASDNQARADQAEAELRQEDYLGDQVIEANARASAAEAALADAGFHHDADNGWHRIEPGIDVDMTAEGRGPDPRWCNVCGSTVAVLDTNQETQP